MLNLPRPQSSGVELERIYSISSRFVDYSKTIKIWKTSPLLGVGYNNLCLLKQLHFGETSFKSHSCSGSDSSILLILATTGFVGFFLFIDLIGRMYKYRARGVYGDIFYISIVAVLVHSMFVNSLFYPWVMGWLALLGGMSVKQKLSKGKTGD
jgi:O-antigen ligase